MHASITKNPAFYNLANKCVCIHLTTQMKKKIYIRNIYRYIVKNIKERRFFFI